MPDNPTITIRGFLKGPRWAGAPTALLDRAWQDPRIHLELIEEKHLLSVTIRYEVAGPAEAVRAFQRDVEGAVQQYNAL